MVSVLPQETKLVGTIWAEFVTTSIVFFFFFTRGPHTKQEKKIVRKTYSTATVHCRAIQCKQGLHTAILKKSGKGRHVYARVALPLT